MKELEELKIMLDYFTEDKLRYLLDLARRLSEQPAKTPSDSSQSST